jgi:hypothetical protein
VNGFVKRRSGFSFALRVTLAAAAVAVTTPPAQSQSTRTFSLRTDNDAFDFWMAPWNRPDDEYTSGVHLAYDGGDAPWWARRFLSGLQLCAAQSTVCRTSRFEIGQDIYTPFVPPTGAAATSARPNAGWLYLGQSAERFSTGSSDVLTLALGVTGPPSLARFTQRIAHSVGPAYNRPTDWSSQVGFEPGVIARFEHAARFTTPTDAPLGVDLVPHAGASVGNVISAADAGARLRFGWRMSHPWLPPSRDFGFDLMIGASGRAVARDLFLDGNTYQDGPRVGHEPFVESGEAGFEFHMRGISLAYRAVTDSRAYGGGPRWHPWASMVGGVTLE